ncbi:MAG TPA: MarR family transcriptional regulator [Spirochaetia bacterium]|nr:MarR family transcriptional regulator [Spirochaetia bacterium]
MAMDDYNFKTIDADLEEFRRHLRVRVRRALRESIGQGVGSPAFHIVEALVTRGPVSPSDLAAALEVRTSTVAAHLDRLEELGWAKREPAAPGTNRVGVSATAAGRQAFDHYVAVRRAVLVDMLKPLSPEQVTALAQVLHICVGAQTAAARAAGGGDPR